MKPSTVLKCSKTFGPDGERIYTVHHKDNPRKAILTSKSQNRDYVALMIYIPETGHKPKVMFRFGRWNLVGKGESRYFINSMDPAYVLVKVEDK